MFFREKAGPLLETSPDLSVAGGIIALGGGISTIKAAKQTKARCPVVGRSSWRSFSEPPQQPMQHSLAVLFIDCFGQRNSHRAHLDAVLRVAAVGDAVFAHDSFQTLVTRHSTRGVHVEETHLRNRLRTNIVVFVVL